MSGAPCSIILIMGLVGLIAFGPGHVAADANAVVLVFFDGRQTDVTTIEASFCAVLGASPCSRLQCTSLDLTNSQFTVATVSIAAGVPSAEVWLSQLTPGLLITRPRGIFRFDLVTVPPTPPRSLIPDSDKNIYIGAGGAVAGAIAALFLTYCCCIRKRNTRRETPISPTGTNRAMSLLDLTAPSPSADTEALWAKLRELEERTARLSQRGESGRHAADMIEADMLRGYEASQKADSNAPGDDALDVVTPLLSLEECPDGYLPRPLVNAPLAERVPPELSTHWSLQRDFPQLPASIGTITVVARSTLCGLGVFATRFIDPGTIMFPYLTSEYFTEPSIRFTEAGMFARFGYDWAKQLHFVLRHPSLDLFIVAEEPRARGWGCLVNSSWMTDLEPNCEVVWNTDIPYVAVTAFIPPLAELLLEYSYPM